MQREKTELFESLEMYYRVFSWEKNSQRIRRTNMLLAIDVGNTNITIGVFDKEN